MKQFDVIVADHQSESRRSLEAIFSSQGFAVRPASSAEGARALIEDRPPSLAVLDVHLRGEPSASLVRWISMHHPSVGIVLLTDTRDVIDCVVGLELGADDYMSRPLNEREVVARARGVLRRLRLAPATLADLQFADGEARCVVGTCSFEPTRRRLFDRHGTHVPLAKLDAELLYILVRHPRRPMSREQLLELLMDTPWDVVDRGIDQRIVRLRRAIESNPKRPTVIRTVRNVGYAFLPQALDA